MERVAPRVVEQLCSQACQRFAEEAADAVPAWISAELSLLSQAEALRVLHLCAPGQEPDSTALAKLQRGDHEAHRRLVFDELFSLELAVALRRSAWERHRAMPWRSSAAAAARLREVRPFQLTTAQERVIAEIVASMSREQPMHRLLQGDVGSGKTAVAFAAAQAAMASGLQAAVMAPTEILARQHFQLMEPWCRALGTRAALLTGETPRAVRSSLLALADAGQVQLLVGTHALLARELSLPNLGLAVVDEQHRFGVIQRARLRDQGADQPLPHLLVMTATPIPRTLALSLYGDLDLSVLDEKPPGRHPSRTRLYLGAERGHAYRFVEEQLAAGQQAFVVCPLVEQSEASDVVGSRRGGRGGPPELAMDAVGVAERLRRRFPDYRVGLVHGRLAPLERDRTMAAFRARELDLLVATTVIEVGIDKPSANVMVVERAERFGLAQLHQLRGRVGRGLVEGHCLLLSEVSPDTPAGQRLAALVRTDDGFEIAEVDLSLRGPGELFGTRQAGIPRLRFADLRRHLDLLAEARRAAARVVERDPQLRLPEHQQAAEEMRRRWERMPLVGAEAG